MAKDVLLNVYGCYNGALKRELTNFQSFTMQTAKAQQKKNLKTRQPLVNHTDPSL